MDKKDSCNPDTCQYHKLTEAIVNDLKDAVKKLMEGQDQMKETVIQLAEAFKGMERITSRVDKLEDQWETHANRAEDECKNRHLAAESSVNELKVLVYKIIGVGISLTFIIGTVLVPILVFLL